MADRCPELIVEDVKFPPEGSKIRIEKIMLQTLRLDLFQKPDILLKPGPVESLARKIVPFRMEHLPVRKLDRLVHIDPGSVRGQELFDQPDIFRQVFRCRIVKSEFDPFLKGRSGKLLSTPKNHCCAQEQD